MENKKVKKIRKDGFVEINARMGILSFVLPDDAELFLLSQKGADLSFAVSDFYNNSLRRRIKYGDKTVVEIETIREEFVQAMKDWDCGDLF